VPDEPAASSVWQPPQPAEAKTALPELPPPAPLCCSFTHLSKSACETTVTGARIVAWPSPHSSLQMTGYVPRRVGVTLIDVVRPGTMSMFSRNSGTKKAWMTSSDWNRSCVSRPFGSMSVALVRPFGYLNVHVNCCATTSTCSAFLARASSRERTIALVIPMAVTRIVGMSVHVISSAVFPWIGGPSESSSGAARKRTTEYRIAAATTAKITMQIVTTNQNSKSMRPASLEAETGSHGTASATAAAMPPAMTPIPSSDAIEPLRIRSGA